MENKKVLVIEDEEDIAELLSYNLKKNGYTPMWAASGEAGLSQVRRQKPDLVLLDIMLPGLDGIEVCANLKSEPSTAGIPIIMVTARGEEEDIVRGLEAGAEDYITKPFSPKIAMARVQAVLRRSRNRVDGTPGDELRYHEIVIHIGKHEVRVHHEKIELTHTEFSLLQFLVSRPGWVFTRSQIVDAIKGEDYPVTDRSVDVHVVGLRRKLGTAGDYLETVRGVGYRIRES